MDNKDVDVQLSPEEIEELLKDLPVLIRDFDQQGEKE